jgi:GTP-binding protein Era
MHKAGFVNIVGNPNVGKSTLMNLLVGERISIATFKAQTTRHRIMGILNTEDMQIVFSDTPGVLKPNYKLQESMLNFSEYGKIRRLLPQRELPGCPACLPEQRRPLHRRSA